MFVSLTNEASLNFSLGLTINQVELEHIIVFVNKLVRVRLDSSLHNIILYVYMNKCIQIYILT